ncbi:MAG TPA: hypothetical protein VKY90_01600 [Candidatus Dormibacteraeota bacterium]|nr:hypothetical protein [Candidatus Dormibacteraeota bacterium]
MAARIRSYDVTDILLDERRLNAHRGLVTSYQLIESTIRFQCGKGGLIVIGFSGIHMSDVLADSGIEEAGDVKRLKTRRSSWQPKRFLKLWKTLELEEIYVGDGWQDGPEAILHIDSVEGTSYELALTARDWIRLCEICVRAIGHPWFQVMQSLTWSRLLGEPSDS